MADQEQAFEEVAGFIRANEVGRRAFIETPFGRRLIAYADLTASGRYLHFVESWIRQVRPYYANTHTAVSSTGRILTELRESARGVVHRTVNAGEQDVVLFCGSGATAAAQRGSPPASPARADAGRRHRRYRSVRATTSPAHPDSGHDAQLRRAFSPLAETSCRMNQRHRPVGAESRVSTNEATSR